jgi:cation diffusion facilitator CzcD-associated flavoprotein CzcO
MQILTGVQVIIVGAGQAGLSLGARLGQLNVDTLIIESVVIDAVAV